jgi:hypothetical protein
MAIGPGKYDHLCTYVREQAHADAVLLIVLGGNLGNGFSCQSATEDLQKVLPSLLRQIAVQIEAGIPTGQN